MEWILVTDRLPENEIRVLVIDQSGCSNQPEFATFVGVKNKENLFCLDNGDWINAVCWMEVPELPNSEAAMPSDTPLVSDVANDTYQWNSGPQTHTATLTNDTPMPKTEEQLVRKFIDDGVLERAEKSYNAAGWTTEHKGEGSISFSKPAPTEAASLGRLYEQMKQK